MVLTTYSSPESSSVQFLNATGKLHGSLSFFRTDFPEQAHHQTLPRTLSTLYLCHLRVDDPWPLTTHFPWTAVVCAMDSQQRQWDYQPEDLYRGNRHAADAKQDRWDYKQDLHRDTTHAVDSRHDQWPGHSGQDLHRDNKHDMDSKHDIVLAYNHDMDSGSEPDTSVHYDGAASEMAFGKANSSSKKGTYGLIIPSSMNSSVILRSRTSVGKYQSPCYPFTEPRAPVNCQIFLWYIVLKCVNQAPVCSAMRGGRKQTLAYCTGAGDRSKIPGCCRPAASGHLSR